MRIVTMSDLHFGKRSDLYPLEALAEIDADVFYFGGDVAEPGYFEQGLGLIARSPATHKLFTLGNNDLEQLEGSQLTEHYDELSDRVAAYGFHLLDKEPYIIDHTAFIGNVGWYDGSLWSPYPGTTRFPNERETIRDWSIQYFREKEYREKVPDGLTPERFYHHCTQRLMDHIQQAEANEEVDAIILGIHFLPDKRFTDSGNPKYAYRNFFMGAAGHAAHYQNDKVILGFTGHTHRSGKATIATTPVFNISGTEQPMFFDITDDYSIGERDY